MSRTYRNYGPWINIEDWDKPWQAKGDHKKINWWDVKKPQSMKNELHRKNRSFERENLNITKITDGDDDHLSFHPYKKVVKPWDYD